MTVPEKVDSARRVVEAFEEGLKKGTASVNLDGKMVDIPVYGGARLLLEHTEAVAKAKLPALPRGASWQRRVKEGKPRLWQVFKHKIRIDSGITVNSVLATFKSS